MPFAVAYPETPISGIVVAHRAPSDEYRRPVLTVKRLQLSLYRRYSHAGHHTNTWFNHVDPQKPYGNPLKLGRYLNVTLGPLFYVDAARQLFRHSSGRFTPC